jgi:hypothetical protein
MTYKQLGQLVKQNPYFRHKYGDNLESYPDEFLAERYLEAYPRHRKLISPGADRLKELINTPIRTEVGFFDSWADFYINEAQHIQNRASLVRVVHDAEIFHEAAQRGQTVPMMESEHAAELAMRVESHRTELRLKEYWETASLDLDAADRSELKAHYQLNYLRSQLRSLYERREQLLPKRNRAAKDELQLINQHIKMLEDDFNARGKQTLVSPSNGQGVFQADDEADSSTNSASASQAATDDAPTPNLGNGKRRAGFAS